LLLELAPYLIPALVVFAIIGHVRRRKGQPGAARRMPGRPVVPARPVAPPVSGWVMVPVWMGSGSRPHIPEVIDAEVIDERWTEGDRA
jgi:hypothetical protein